MRGPTYLWYTIPFFQRSIRDAPWRGDGFIDNFRERTFPCHPLLDPSALLADASTTFVTAGASAGELQAIRATRGVATAAAGRREKRCSGDEVALLEGYERRGATRALRLV